jgi:hypothetical protein
MESKDQILRDLKQLSNQAQLLFINVNEMRDKVMELHTDNLQKDYQIEKLKAEVERLKADNHVRWVVQTPPIDEAINQQT